MSIEIKTNYVEPLDKQEVIALLDGSISLKRANELKPIYTQRIDYIIQSIFKTFGRNLQWYYTKDFTDSIKHTKDENDVPHISYVHKDFGMQEGVSIAVDNGKYSSSFPASWLYEDFEETLQEETKEVITQ